MQPNPVNLEWFWYWINERHSIYLNKSSGEPWPWTKDEIFQTYAFCNVFRELDKATVAFRQLIREPYADHEHLWFAYCLARQINWPDTVAYIMAQTGFPDVWNPEGVYEAMRYRQMQGHKLYTGAYMLRGDIQNGIEENNKPRYTVFKVLDKVWRGYRARLCEREWIPAVLGHSIEATTKWLEHFDGWGGFLSYEVATDLRHTRYLSQAPDIMTWANPGPGAKRGLNRIFGRPVKRSLAPAQALVEMLWLLAQSRSNLDDHVPALEMRDIEHSLCELDKYLRVKNGEGRPRSRYHPPVVQ